MQAVEHLSITLPVEIARIIRDKVAAGEYATGSEVIGDGLLSLIDRDRAVDQWLAAGVVSVYDRLRADPDSAVAIEDVRNRIATERAGSTRP